MNRVNIACVGAGYWGKNLVRVFHDLPEVHLSQVCDADPKIRAAIQQLARLTQILNWRTIQMKFNFLIFIM